MAGTLRVNAMAGRQARLTKIARERVSRGISCESAMKAYKKRLTCFNILPCFMRREDEVVVCGRCCSNEEDAVSRGNHSASGRPHP